MSVIFKFFLSVKPGCSCVFFSHNCRMSICLFIPRFTCIVWPRFLLQWVVFVGQFARRNTYVWCYFIMHITCFLNFFIRTLINSWCIVYVNAARMPCKHHVCSSILGGNQICKFFSAYNKVIGNSLFVHIYLLIYTFYCVTLPAAFSLRPFHDLY